MQKKWLLLTISIIVVLSLVAAGCSNNKSNTTTVKGNDVAPANNAGNKPKEGEEFVLAFTSPALTSPAYAYMLAGLKEVLAVEGQDIKLTVQSPAAESDAGAQVSIVENFISLGVDVIAISATNNDAIAPVVVKANNVSIPVFAFNTPVPWPDGKAMTDIGYDQREAGRIAGKHIAEILDGKGKIAIIQGLPSMFTTERVGGAKEILANYPDIEVVAEQSGDWLKDKSYSVTQNILTANPDVKLIYTISDEMALGAKAAAKASGSEAYVLGLDGTMDAFESIQNGDLDATVDTHLANEGRNIAKAAIMLKNGETVPPQIYETPSVVTKDNAKEIYEQMKEMMDKYGK